jgi:RNA polymerase-associated protein RTF1
VEVVDVDNNPSNKPYKFGKSSIARRLSCKWGVAERSWPMDQVSNQRPSSKEWNEWRNELEKRAIRKMSKREVAEKREALLSASTFQYTSEAVKNMVQEKQKLRRVRGLGFGLSRVWGFRPTFAQVPDVYGRFLL